MASEYLDRALQKAVNRQREREALASARLLEARRKCPAIRELDLSIARGARDGADVRQLMEKRDDAVRQWLRQSGLPADYLTPPPACGKCNDSGYCGGTLCSCVLNDAASHMMDGAGLSDDGPSFERFDLSLFPEDISAIDGYSVREYMRLLRDSSIAYADRFPNIAHHNLLLTGKPGRGKSYLMDCVARRIISRGYWVVRATSFKVNDIMAKALVDRADPDSLFNCELLVLDDLGSEPILNKVTISSYFNLFNERSDQGKPFLISTNLTPDEILNRYGDRVFSRLTDQRTTQIIEFKGVDLRKM